MRDCPLTLHSHWLSAVAQLADPTEHNKLSPTDVKIFFTPAGQVAIDLSELATNDDAGLMTKIGKADDFSMSAAPKAPVPKSKVPTPKPRYVAPKGPRMFP
jgi:hypothetical protein